MATSGVAMAVVVVVVEEAVEVEAEVPKGSLREGKGRLSVTGEIPEARVSCGVCRRFEVLLLLMLMLLLLLSYSS